MGCQDALLEGSNIIDVRSDGLTYYSRDDRPKIRNGPLLRRMLVLIRDPINAAQWQIADLSIQEVRSIVQHKILQITAST